MRRQLVFACVLMTPMGAAMQAGADPADKFVAPSAGANAADSSGGAPLDRDPDGQDQVRSPNQRSVESAAYLPWSMSPTVGAVAGLATAHGGYDGARGSALTETTVELRVWERLAVRGGAQLSDTTKRLRPSIGARLQILAQGPHAQGRHPIDGSVSISYRAEGLTEPEGEIETVIAIGRRIGPAYVIGNLAYGQDPEGRERDGEVRTAVVARVSKRVHLGMDGRWRFDLGSDVNKLKASNEATSDLDVGPVAALTLGPFAVTGHAGASVVRRVGRDAAAGLVALIGMGTSF